MDPQAEGPITATGLAEQRAFDNALKERELSIKEGELAVRREELLLKKREQELSRWRNPLAVAILAASIAAAANLIVTQVNSLNERKLAKQRYEQTREDDREKRLAGSVAEVSRHLTRGYQKQAWLLWTVVNAPQSANEAMLKEYDLEMKEVLPSVIAAHIAIANQDRALYFSLAPIVREMTVIDSELTEAAIRYKLRYSLGKSAFDSLNLRLSTSLARLGRRISSAYMGVPEDDGAPATSSDIRSDARSHSCPAGSVLCNQNPSGRAFSNVAPTRAP